jgi:glucosamine--fructose-6-phosphate aminotransferase (isomerizing)
LPFKPFLHNASAARAGAEFIAKSKDSEGFFAGRSAHLPAQPLITKTLMCGIIGYVGPRPVQGILLEGLSRLEYRGYDSAGLALQQPGRAAAAVLKAVGRVDCLREACGGRDEALGLGIAHTRWATHGEPSEANAHPHADASGRLLLVHNGVIENHATLRAKLLELGHVMRSQTDSEVLAHWVGRFYEASEIAVGAARLRAALDKALELVRGTYGLAVMHADLPGVILGARLGSPLVVGIGQGEHYLASDVSALLKQTREVLYLDDHEVVELRADGFELGHRRGVGRVAATCVVDWQAQDAEKDGHAHHMLKEIMEQPQALENAMRGRLDFEQGTSVFGGLNATPGQLRAVTRALLSGCGSAHHAALVGEHWFESIAGLPTEVEIASELRYRQLPLMDGTLHFAVSQSGETLDTLAALREVKRRGISSLGIVNTVGSSLARESDGGCHLHAGPEIGVAATKTFTSTLGVLAMLALHFGRLHRLGPAEGMLWVRQLQALPDLMRETLCCHAQVSALAPRLAEAQGMLFLGRLACMPVAMEGALKMREISYQFASGHSSAELKHGIIAQVSEQVPSIFIAPHDAVFEKNLANIEEVLARRGPVMAITTQGGGQALRQLTDAVIELPACHALLAPLLCILPLQLLAYEVALLRGCDVDKPRHLAKSVTVE